MAFTGINKSTDYFNTTLWTGDGNSTQNVTGTGFTSDFTWNKGRSGSGDHQLYDKVRGVQKMIISNSSNAESTNSIGLTAWSSDGFTVGSDMTGNGSTFVSWNWKAGTTSGITTNSSSNITPSGYSFNATSKFSVIKWSGTGVDGAYLPHGLGVAPSVAIIKKTSASEEWVVYHIGLGSNQAYLRLNNTAAQVTGSGIWYSYTPDATNIRLSNDSWVNASGSDYVGYFFSDTAGYQKHGSYVGNGFSNGTFVYTGFKPAWVLIKDRTRSEAWYIYDGKILGYNGQMGDFLANTNASVGTNYAIQVDMLSNGFKLNTTASHLNGSGEAFVYSAFAKSPFTANVDGGLPTTAR